MGEQPSVERPIEEPEHLYRIVGEDTRKTHDSGSFPDTDAETVERFLDEKVRRVGELCARKEPVRIELYNPKWQEPDQIWYRK